MIGKAKFRKIKGVWVILCEKCNKIVKTEKEFDVIEKLGLKGDVILSPRYCEEHAHFELNGYEKKMNMLRRGIKEVFMKKNILNIDITRPNQKLVIIRGIPGSGKSTLANKIVGEGKIHSTDTLIEATGDYNEFFKKMVDSNDWSAHSKIHNDNFINAKKSMLEGVKIVIIDNTNIKASEPKLYVEAALKMGYNENNVIIEDVGDGGVTPQVLFERNTHGVPLKTIEKMVKSHKSIGNLTVKKILEAKDMGKYKSLYSGVFLDKESKDKLVDELSRLIPKGFKIFAHHMTIVFGKPLEDRGEYGKEVNLTATHVGVNDMVMAVKVSGYPSNNETPHITVAVNVDGGGKPFMSNKITQWDILRDEIKLSGVVTEQTA